MIIQNSNGLGASLNVTVNDRSYRLRQIMGEDSLYLYFSMPNYTPIAVGAYVDYQATRYYLHKPDHFKKHHSRNYEYSLVLTSEIGSLSKYKMRDSAEKRLKFPFTAKPQQHLQMLVDNLNERENGWAVGACIDAPEKLISYNHTSLNEALQMIADAFETEWEVKDRTIHLKKVEYNHINPLALSYGKGNGFKPGIGRSNVDEKSAIEILHVQGGERNIDYSKYGNKELLMPIGQTYNYEGRTYVVSADGRSIQRSGKPIVTGVEDSLDAAHIYPQRVGEVSEVVVVNAAKHLYDFKDASIPANLDFNACQIAGEKMTVVFQTGMLAGREFDIDSYVHASRLFRIVPQEQDGMHLPDNIFKPVPTDKYAIFGIQLPAAYIRDDATKTGASWDLFKEAVKYFYEHETPRFTFTGELDGIWAKQDWLNIGGKIVLGGFVNFSDPQFFPAGELIRIVGVKDFVNNPYSPEIELSNTPVSGGFMSEIGKIKSQEVVANELHRQSISYAKRGYQDSIQTMEMLQEAFKDTFTNAISPVTVKTMSLLVGDESLQFRFVNNTTTPVEVVHNVTFNPATKKLNAPAGIIQHMTLGLDTISSAHAPSEYKFWNVPNFDTPPLVSADKSYYLYIKANKANTSAIFYISEDPIGLETVAGYYHFLMGILNTESDDDRSYVSLHGFTEILPGRITTNKIVSADGNTFFDLQTGDIQGKFKFSSGKKIEDAITEVEDQITDQQIYIEYSVNGTTGWHTAFGTGDKFMRQKKGAGNWSSAIRLVGIDGTSGTDGRSVNSMTTEFYLSNSKTSQTGGSWLTSPPAWVNGKYLWTRVKIDYINPASTAYTTPSVSSEWEAVNDLEIGGTNLLKNTASGVGWSKTDFDAETRTFTRETTGTSELFVALIGQTRLENNTTYTLSAWIKSNGQVKDVDYFVYNKSISKVHSKAGIAVTTNWQFITFTFTTDSSTDYSEAIIRFDNNGSKIAGVNAILYVKMPKLEKGSKATDWSPSPEDVPSALDYLATAIQDGSTDIEGGLVSTNILKVKDRSGAVTGGMSGLSNDNVGFWTGGTYQSALSNAASLIFRKDGSGRLANGKIKFNTAGDLDIGNVEVGGDGSLVIMEGTHQRVLITKENISTLASIAGSTQDEIKTNVALSNSINFSYNGASTTSSLPNKIVVKNHGTTLRIVTTLGISAVIESITGGINGSVSIILYLYKNGVMYKNVGQYNLPITSVGYITNSKSINIDNYVTNGTYELRFVTSNTPNMVGSATGTISASTMRAIFDGSKRTTEIGKNGIGIIAGAKDYSFFGVENGVYKAVERVSNATEYDKPGVLLAGRMEAGTVFKYWGAKYREGSYREGNNIYRIHHNIGHVDYSVQLTPQSDARMWVIQRATTYCRIQASVATLNFDFAIFGNNNT